MAPEWFINNIKQVKKTNGGGICASMNEYRSMDLEKIKVKFWVVWWFLALSPKKSLQAVLYCEMSKSIQYVIIHGQVCITMVRLQLRNGHLIV